MCVMPCWRFASACCAPMGIAYVSYNTYPGWHTMKMLRDAMLYHGQDADTPAEKAEQGRVMVSFLAQYATDGLH